MTPPALTAQDIREPLEAFLRGAAGADRVRSGALERLPGGAVQENWRLDCEIVGGPEAGTHQLVLRVSSATAGVAESLPRAGEFAVLKAAHAAGVTVPEPLWLCTDPAVIGREFYVMRRVGGTAAGHRLVKDPQVGDALAERLGAELARIHSIRPPHPGLDMVPTARPDPARHLLDKVGAYLARTDAARPGLEWAARRLAALAPAPPAALTLVHHDFRTGNYMVADGALAGILDWEFVEWGDPMEDVGWFCARCWRFGAWDREAGGIGTRAAFYRGYEQAGGGPVDRRAVPFWEAMAHVRWAYIAIQQAGRHLSGGERSLELALTGRIAAELEYEALLLLRGLEDGGRP